MEDGYRENSTASLDIDIEHIPDLFKKFDFIWCFNVSFGKTKKRDQVFEIIKQ